MYNNKPIIGTILAILLLLVTINSTIYFLTNLKVSPLEWVVFNACAPSNILYILCFTFFLVTGNKTGLTIGILPLFFFGTMGLIIFPWGGYNIIPQISHILMTLNVIWAVYSIFSTGAYKAATIGFLISILICGSFIAFQQIYTRTHQEDLHKILQIQ